MRRPLLLALAGLSGLALAVVPALAATTTVTATNYEFTPPTVTVRPGDSVKWISTEGSHTVHFDDEPAGNAIDGDGYERSFANVGTYEYYCDPHGAPNGVGMAGQVIVSAEQTTTTTTTTTQPTTTTTTTTPPPTTTLPEETVPFQVTVEPTRSRFCTRKSRRCRRPGVELSIDASEQVVLTGKLTRRPLSGGRARPAGTVRRQALTGESTWIFTRNRAGKLLKPGRYTLRLQVVDRPDYLIPAIAFRVRPS